ncbi:hypothetical protein EY643_17395 [Halioglobus maricola]|uniref:Outer membrane protein beta-barrel domain-containing protein n=1 Tax=Halioglobus maricola TaxID=2601894 RepID=A0A5P9NN89_9GAMM|nr:hypothetical protein [Halioglobus maricola]QFU77290.1 hypothetical protein EY643_17395 [Halioglobus maricola]
MKIGKTHSALTAAALSSLLTVASGTAHADDWEFAISPLFLWGLSMEGDATINGNTAPLDLEFKDDILENMEAVFTVHFEARKGDWTIFSEYQYVDLDPDVAASIGPVNVNADISFKETMFELGGAWAMLDSDGTRWELIGGGRYSDQEMNTKINIDGPLPPELPAAKLKGGDDWWHAFGGMRVFHDINDRWTFIGRADYGYGGTDNSAWNASFMFDYRFKDWGSAFIGARFLDYDYNDDAYGFEATKSGPLAGLTIYW